MAEAKGSVQLAKMRARLHAATITAPDKWR
jgi:hypothetical protein